MEHSNTVYKPRNNVPFSPNDYWDRSRFVDPNPTHSLASLPGHIQSSGPESEPGLNPWLVPGSRPSTEERPRLRPQVSRLSVNDARGRTADRSYAQQLKIRSRSPQFVPFERSVSSSRSTVASRTFSPQPRLGADEKQRPGIIRVASDRDVPAAQWYHSQSEWEQRETQSATEPKTQTQAQFQGQDQDQSTERDPDEVVMSSTAYPGQEWTPAGFHGWEYF